MSENPLERAAIPSGGASRVSDFGPASIIIRPMPKVIFFWPTMAAAIVSGFIASFSETSLFAAYLFLIPFTFNLFVITFDFSRISVVLMLVAFVAIMFGLMYWNTQSGGIYEALYGIIKAPAIHANAGFYFSIAIVLGFLFLCVFVSSRFNFWEMTSNELIHHHGMLGDAQRYPSPNLKFTKEIEDVFQWVLCGAGRLILYPSGEAKAIVLENVPRINAIEQKLKELLGSLSVSIHERKQGSTGD